jgi:hypothetical protein
VTGSTPSPDFPLVRPTQTYGGPADPDGPGDVFVSRFDPIGRPVYSTVFGGSGHEVGMAIAVDGSGRAHVVGDTRSPDLPLVNALQDQLRGFSDALLLTIADDACPADITDRVLVVPFPALPFAGGLFRLQFIVAVNSSATPIATPVSLTFDRLTPGMFLVSSGLTFCPLRDAAQFATLGTPGAALAPGSATLTAVLFLTLDPALTLSYSSRVLAGLPHR